MTTTRKRKPPAPLTPAQIEAARVAAEAERARKEAHDRWWALLEAERAVGVWPWIERTRVKVSWSNGQSPRMYHDIGYVPEFQRGPVWDGERAIAYVTAWCRGLASSSMLVWHYGNRGWVLDGQQRLMALGFTLRDADGNERRGATGYLDFETGAIVSEPGPMRATIAEITAQMSASDIHGSANEWWRRQHDWISKGENPRLAAMAFDADSLRNSIPHTLAVLGGWSQDVTPAEAREYFRHWNIPGVPFAEGEIDRLLSIVGGAL